MTDQADSSLRGPPENGSDALTVKWWHGELGIKCLRSRAFQTLYWLLRCTLFLVMDLPISILSFSLIYETPIGEGNVPNLKNDFLKSPLQRGVTRYLNCRQWDVSRVCWDFYVSLSWPRCHFCSPAPFFEGEEPPWNSEERRWTLRSRP